MKTYIVRFVAALFLVLGLGTALVTVSGTPALAQTKVVAAYGSISIQNAPLWIAKEAGFFKKHGLDVEFVQLTGPRITNGLISNSVQFISAGGSLGMVSVLAGSDIVVIGTVIERMTYDLVVKSNIKTFADLKGKIGVVQQRGDLTGIGMTTLLAANGLDSSKDINMVQGGGDSERLAAMIAGSAEFTVVQPDFRADYEKAGYKRLVNAMEVPGTGWLALSFATTRSYAKSNPAAVTAFLKAVGDAMALLHNNRDETIKIVAKVTGRDPAQVAPGYDLYKGVMKKDPAFALDVIKATVKGLSAVNPEMKPDENPTKFADTSFADALAKEGYFKK
jgi:NitT/TauT family transport system substrate-binding protein